MTTETLNTGLADLRDRASKTASRERLREIEADTVELIRDALAHEFFGWADETADPFLVEVRRSIAQTAIRLQARD